MESSLVVEQLSPVRHRTGFEELSGIASGQPVSVGVTNPGLFPDDATSEAFAAAVRQSLVLQHPGLARTLALEANGAGRWAVLWERFSGPTLDRVLSEKGPLLPDEAVTVAVSVAQTVAAAHRSGVLHGDLSPEWVTLLARPAAVEVRLGGFGLGLLPSFSGGKKASVAADITALGSFLHELLTGQVPHGRIGQLPEAAIHLGAVLSKCLGLDLSDRFRSVDEFLEALGDANRTRVSGGHVVPASSARRSSIALRTLGPWSLETLLGEGAMGQVFLGRHTLLGRQAAIKVLRPEQYQREDLIQRFFQEARSVNQINHEHIVEISDFGQELGADGKPSAVYFVMELLQGETLSARIARAPLPIERTLHIIRQLASALSAAHRLGVVHRDVKTDNVFLIERRGDTEYVKVLDFGVAKLTQLTPDAPTVATMDGAIIGTPTSMSPEQASGGSVDARADVYAVGVLLYQLLSGHLPIDADSFGKLIALLLTQPPAPLPAVTLKGEPIPPALAALVMRCLEKDPAKRPQSMDALLTELDSPRVQPADALASAPRSRRGLIAAVVSVALAATAGGIFLSRPPPPLPVPVVVHVPEVRVVVDAGPALAVAEPPDAAVPDAEDAGLVAAAEEATPDASVKLKLPVKPVPLARALTELQATLKRTLPRFKACVDSYPTLLPEKQGAIQLRFTMEPSGELSGVTVKDAAIKGALRDCVEKAMKSVRAPRNVGPARLISYNFTYSLLER